MSAARRPRHRPGCTLPPCPINATVPSQLTHTRLSSDAQAKCGESNETAPRRCANPRGAHTPSGARSYRRRRDRHTSVRASGPCPALPLRGLRYSCGTSAPSGVTVTPRLRAWAMTEIATGSQTPCAVARTSVSTSVATGASPRSPRFCRTVEPDEIPPWLPPANTARPVPQRNHTA